MRTDETVDCISAEDVAAALADNDLGRLLQAVTLGSSSWADEANRGSLVKECTADGECLCGRPEECPLRSNAVLAQHALGQLAHRATTGQLQLARGTVGAMQLLALLREALRWRQHAAANAFVALAAGPGAPRLPLTWLRNLLVIALRSSVPQQLPALRGIVSLCNEAAAREGKPALPPAPNCRSLSALDAAFPHRRQHAAAPFPAIAEASVRAEGCCLPRQQDCPAGQTLDLHGHSMHCTWGRCRGCLKPHPPALLPALQCQPAGLLEASPSTAACTAIPASCLPVPILPQILSSAIGIAEHVRIEDLYRACDNDSLPELLRLGPPPSPAVSMLAWSKVMQWGACSLHMRLQVRDACRELNEPAAESQHCLQQQGQQQLLVLVLVLCCTAAALVAAPATAHPTLVSILHSLTACYHPLPLLHPPQTRGSRPAHHWALPIYVRFADALDALVAAGGWAGLVAAGFGLKLSAG